jgi:intracellular multiplication protein IcmB
VASKLEAVLLHIISVLKTDVEDYCDLETTDGNAIVGTDGSLASVVKFNGTKGILGREQFGHMVELVTQTLAVYFKSKGHQVQVVFRRDLDASETLEANAIQQSMTADRLSLDVKDLIDEGVAKYSDYVYDEETYMVFWSRPSLLDPAEVKLSRDETNLFRKTHDIPSMSDAQNLMRPIRFLSDRHAAFVAKLCDDLQSKEFGCSLEVIDVVDMIRSIKRSVAPDTTSATWRPAIPGSPIPLRWKTSDEASDASDHLYPRLPRQIMGAMGELGQGSGDNLPDPTTLRLGSRIYAPLLVEVPPQSPQFFNSLFNAMNRAETREGGRVRAVPYSVSFMLESDGMSVMALKSMFATVLGFSNEGNRNMNLAAKALRERVRDNECAVKLRISAMTWAASGPEGARELAVRKSKLWRNVEAWGSCTVVERTGNPMMAFQSNAVGLTWKHIANAGAAPLSEAISMLPLTRPASPFAMGSTIFRSLDGKILRYQRFSSQQSTWITLIAGKPGSGKSVLMNNSNLESCLMPGLSRLPYVCIVDVGVSSSGFISMVEDNLPPDLKHLAVYKRLQNTDAYCINVMDTPLGMRKPLARDRSFLVNFLTALVTPPERRGRAYDGMSNFVGRMIDAAFKLKSDQLEKSAPETFKQGHDDVLDAAVANIRFPVRQATTYWELHNAFFGAGLLYEAELAQRYAMPTLDTLVAVATTPEVAEEYDDNRVAGGQLIYRAFTLGIRDAVADFPIFSSHTKFDIGPARILAIDLQDVVGQGSDSAIKQTTLMYMVARQAFMKKVAFSDEDLKVVEPKYRSHYERLIADIAEDYKVFCMDEYYLTKIGGGKADFAEDAGESILQAQVMIDGRQARKWKMELVLASQLMSDFGELASIATTFFMLDAGTEKTRKWMRENVGMDSVQEQALINYVLGPTRHGATFLARFVTEEGTYSQLFTSTMGPMRLWALATGADDRKVRNMVSAAIGGNPARATLARHFPAGSCGKFIEKLKLEMFGENEFVDDKMKDSVCERVAHEVIEGYYTALGAAA